MAEMMKEILEPTKGKKNPIVEPNEYDRLQTLPIIDPDNPSRKITGKEEKYLREMVTYEFSNLEEPGLMQKFIYGSTRNKHTFSFFHGGRYKVPRFIAKHVESKSTPIWGWKPDGSGNINKQLNGRKSRFQMREVFEYSE